MIGQIDALTFICPSCRVELEKTSTGWKCRHEGYNFHVANGIADFILPSRRARVDEFLRLYRLIREKEGWGSNDIRYYFHLPHDDITGHHSDIWRIRARSFECFLDDVGGDHRIKPRTVLDLGAGNCWLSLQLARRGCRVVAADINIDANDGLGVAFRMQTAGAPVFGCVRAEFNFLPFKEGSFDVISFNASLHYARNPYDTLLQTLRYLSEKGIIYVLDSPIYTDSEHGEAMVTEKIESFKKRFGITLSREFAGSYLTYYGIEQLKNSCSVEFVYPSYGLKWYLRPMVAFLRDKRHPASFAILKIWAT